MAIPHQANLSLSPGMQLLATVRLLARKRKWIVLGGTLDLTTDGDVSPSLPVSGFPRQVSGTNMRERNGKQC